MAGTITHAFFAMDVYDKLNKKPKKLLENYTNNLKTFGQGHDVFTFSKLKLSKKLHKKKDDDCGNCIKKQWNRRIICV